MDERIIYVIFILLWAAYKLYQKSRKAKNTEQPAVGSRQSATASEQKIPTGREGNFKSIFEKILLGEEFSAPANTKDNEELNTENEMIPDTPNASQQKKEALIQELKPAELKEIIKAEEISQHIKTKFNLKQALIYSVILNRPYQ